MIYELSKLRKYLGGKNKSKRNIRLRLEQAQDRINITSKGGVVYMGLLEKKKKKRNGTNVLRNNTRKKKTKHQKMIEDFNT